MLSLSSGSALGWAALESESRQQFRQRRNAFRISKAFEVAERTLSGESVVRRLRSLRRRIRRVACRSRHWHVSVAGDGEEQRLGTVGDCGALNGDEIALLSDVGVGITHGSTTGRGAGCSCVLSHKSDAPLPRPHDSECSYWLVRL